MELQSNPTPIPVFESIMRTDDNGEFWSSRQLSSILEYSQYQKFKNVVMKAMEACKNSNQQIKDHFTHMSEMVNIGSGAQTPVDDIRLTRYACYLIVQNASPDKEVVALGQTYFAVQTRMQELQQMESYNTLRNEVDRRLYLREQLTEHNKELASTAKSAGVIDPIDFAIFKNFGYKGLYNGLDKKGIQKRKGLKESAIILDHMGSTELAANFFLATQTVEKLKRDKINNKVAANNTHHEVGQKIRGTIKAIGGTMPEDLPLAENIKVVERKAKKGLGKQNDTNI